jgi:hypothetical protein
MQTRTKRALLAAVAVSVFVAGCSSSANQKATATPAEKVGAVSAAILPPTHTPDGGPVPTMPPEGYSIDPQSIIAGPSPGCWGPTSSNSFFYGANVVPADGLHCGEVLDSCGEVVFLTCNAWARSKNNPALWVGGKPVPPGDCPLRGPGPYPYTACCSTDDDLYPSCAPGQCFFQHDKCASIVVGGYPLGSGKDCGACPSGQTCVDGQGKQTTTDGHCQ